MKNIFPWHNFNLPNCEGYNIILPIFRSEKGVRHALIDRMIGFFPDQPFEIEQILVHLLDGISINIRAHGVKFDLLYAIEHRCLFQKWTIKTFQKTIN